MNSFENEKTPSWYVLRAVFGREMRVKKLFDDENVRSFVPMHYCIKEDRQGHKQRQLVPAVRNWVFVYSTKSYLEEFKDKVLRQNKIPLYFLTRKHDDRNVIVTIPDNQMDDFMNVATKVEEDIMYLRPEEVSLSKGDRVRIIGGAFDGLEGILTKVKGKRSKRVVVNIPDLLCVAASCITPDLIQIISKAK